MSLKIPAIPFRQRKTQMYVAVVPISKLDRFSVDTWNPKSVIGRRGYQRRPEEKRVKSISKYFEKANAIMPVAGLLNVREKHRLRYGNGFLTIPDGTDAWVVDMQHRLKGILRAYEDETLKDATFEFPVVITEGLNHIEEAAQFYVINTKARKMDVALTRRLLIENNKIKDLADVKPWVVAAVRITIALNKSLPGNPWFERLRQPNEDRLEGQIGSENSFVSSLKQLLIPGRYRQPRAAAKKLGAYWSAIRENIPEAFDEPRRYLIQKTPGMFAFNSFIAPIVFHRFDENRYGFALRKLRKLGPHFWRGSNKRGARRFGTGMGGYANLADYIKSSIL